MSPTRHRVSVVVGVLVLLTLGTFAVASGYWGGPGNGSASASTGTTQTVTLSPATPAVQLHPGGQTGVVLNIVNPNPGSVRIGSLALDAGQGTGGFAVDGAHSACGLASLAFTTQINGGAGWTVPGTGSFPLTLAGSLSMTADAANACQGASFTVYLQAGS